MERVCHRVISHDGLPPPPSSLPSPSDDAAKFHEDLMHIACTTLSSKILTQHRDLFARLAVEAVLRLKGSGSLDAIKIIKKLGGNLQDSYLEEGTHLMIVVCYMVESAVIELQGYIGLNRIMSNSAAFV